MSDFKVEKLRVKVRLTMTDSAAMEGTIFLAPHSALTHGRQTIREILEDEAPFMALTEEGGGFALIGKRAVAAVHASVEDDPTPEFSRRAKALLKVEGAGEIDGELIVPEGPAAFRVSDYLNGGEEWLRVEVVRTVAMIAKKAVKEVRLL